MTLSSTPVFEGPEKRLLVSFAANPSGVRSSMRDIDMETLRQILSAASCSILSVVNNSHFDAYLLSESSLFIADNSIMLKTCGSTTLLRALPVILDAARTLGIIPLIVQYSRVSFTFPERQQWPHDSFHNEATYLDETLCTQGQRLQIGGSSPDWHLYIAKLAAFSDAPTHTLEIFMFDLDPKAMRHFVAAQTDAHGTTTTSGVRSLLSKYSLVDAFNFQPCGYSLNAINSNTDEESGYITIHVSPEPAASYVSFECTDNSIRLADTIASVVKVFHPGRFTVTFLGCHHSRAIRTIPNAPVDWSKLEKLLGAHFYLHREPVLLQPVNNLWAAVGTFMQRSTSSVHLDFIEDNPILDAIQKQFRILECPPCMDPVSKVRFGISSKDEVHCPLFVVDVLELLRRAEFVRNLGYTLRYPVRCNSDPVILKVLDSLKWSFDAVSIREVNLLVGIGVERNRIVFSSPMLTKEVLLNMNNIGMVSLFGIPDSVVAKSIRASNVKVEIRIPGGAVDESVKVCREILSAGCKKIESFAVDCHMEAHYSDCESLGNVLKERLKTIKSVRDFLPLAAVKDSGVYVGEIFPGCQDYANETLDGLREIGEMEKNFSADIGRWVVAPCTSLVISVIGVRVRFVECDGDYGESYSYYMNDGVYGAFSSIIMERSLWNTKMEKVMNPIVLGTKKEAVESICPGGSEDDGRSSVQSVELFESTLFGPTCDAMDRIWTGALPKLDKGGLIMFENMGAYAASAVSRFNGFADQFETVYIK